MTEAVAAIAQLAVGALLLISAVIKLAVPRSAAQVVRNYGLLPGRLVTPATWALIGAEFFAGAGLVSGYASPLPAIVAAGLFALFIAAMLVRYRDAATVECGCFGVLWRERIGPAAVGRDAALLAAALLAWASGPALRVSDLASDSALAAIGKAVAVLGVASFALYAGALQARLERRTTVTPFDRRARARRPAVPQDNTRPCGCESQSGGLQAPEGVVPIITQAS